MLSFKRARFWFLIAAAGLLCLAVGCTIVDLFDRVIVGSAETTPVVHTPVTSEPDPLDGTRWRPVAFESQEGTLDIPEQPQLFLEFEKGTFTLGGGCNSVGGYYALENGRIKATFSKATEKDCSGSMPGIMEVERAFLLATLTFESYTIEGEQLHIRYAGGELLFHRVPD
jgi:heat shock protein HslJ